MLTININKNYVLNILILMCAIDFRKKRQLCYRSPTLLKFGNATDNIVMQLIFFMEVDCALFRK